MAFCWRADSGPRQFTDWEASEECVMCSHSHEQTHILYFCYTSYLFLYQVIMALHFLNDGVNDIESTRNTTLTS